MYLTLQALRSQGEHEQRQQGGPMESGLTEPALCRSGSPPESNPEWRGGRNRLQSHISVSMRSESV